LETRFEKRVTTSTKRMERKAVRKSVNNSVTGLKFRVKQIKCRENLIEPVVNINNVTL